LPRSSNAIGCDVSRSSGTRGFIGQRALTPGKDRAAVTWPPERPCGNLNVVVAHGLLLLSGPGEDGRGVLACPPGGPFVRDHGADRRVDLPWTVLAVFGDVYPPAGVSRRTQLAMCRASRGSPSWATRPPMTAIAERVCGEARLKSTAQGWLPRAAVAGDWRQTRGRLVA
jgi:hypothetical protein